MNQPKPINPTAAANDRLRPVPTRSIVREVNAVILFRAFIAVAIVYGAWCVIGGGLR